MSRQRSLFALREKLGGLSRPVSSQSRQNHREPGAGPRAILIDENKTVMRFNGAMYDRESESRTAGFRRHERLEQPLFDRVRYTSSLVGHAHHHRPASEALGLRRQLVIRQLRCFQAHFPTGWRRLNRIEKEIEDRTMEQIIIANDDQRVRRKQLADRHVRGLVRVRRYQNRRVMRDIQEIDSADPGNARSREIEELRQQSRESVRLALNELGQGPRVVVCSWHLREELGGASDRGERILDL